VDVRGEELQPREERLPVTGNVFQNTKACNWFYLNGCPG
jgi:hypothetical protein